MLCPVHRLDMYSRQSGDVRFESCATCNGAWFGPRHLLTLDLPRNLYPKALKAFAQANGQALSPPVPVCHDCRAQLRGARIESVHVAICPTCGGVWLAASEFDGVLAWYEKRRKGKLEGLEFDGDASDWGSTQAEARASRVSGDQAHLPKTNAAGANDAADPEANVLSALIDFISAMCGGVVDLASAAVDVAADIGDAVGGGDVD